ncbi:RHS repeat domain-containing protein [Nitrosovibrio sp. Nv17]
MPISAGSVTYAYDVLGRLTTATYGTGVVITYSYDASGNRTSVVTTGAP